MDFNDDTYLDLIVGDRNGFINYFRRLPNGTLTAEPDIVANGTTIDVGENSAPCTVDWNEDGLLDLVIGNDTSKRIRLYLNSGTPSSYLFTTFTEIESSGTPIVYGRCVPHVCDLNEDGKKDLIIGEDLGWVYYYENTGTNAAPSFSGWVKLESNGSPIKWPSGQTDTRVWMDDWNGDGKCDLLLGNYAKNLYIYLNEETEPLVADTSSIPEAGGTVYLTLAAESENAGRNYLILGTVSGTSPGFPLPGGLVTLPLNWDWFTDVVLSLVNSPLFENFMYRLDGSGGSVAKINAPPLIGYSGIVMHYAYCLNNPFDFVSNPVQVEIVP
ncbi:MAG: FG-GAP repeat domain-containing protein [Planctomycetota bacterium]